MVHDAEGNLKPFMLSELIATAQTALKEHGDMIVWAEVEVLGRDDTERYSKPVSYPPVVVDSEAGKEGYTSWAKVSKKMFMIHGW